MTSARSSRWSRRRATGRPRCCRSGPSAAARPSRGCRSTSTTTTRRSCSATWPRRWTRVQPVGERVFEALASPVSSVPGSVVPRLGSAFWSMTTPVVLVLDDVHLLHKTECRDALSVLADHVPGGSRLVLAGRDEPPLRIARLRAEGRILEIGPGDLSLTREEAASLLRAAGGDARRGRRGGAAPANRGLAGRAVPGGAVPAGRRLARGRRRSPSAGTTGWSASTWKRSSWRGSRSGTGCS